MEEPSPAVQYSLRVSECRQSLHQYTVENLFLAVTAAAPCSPVQCLVPISPFEMLSTLTPSSPIRTPTLRKNFQMTCSLASRSSIAVAPSIGIYEVQPSSERASSLAVIQVHSRGYLMASLVHYHLFRSPWGCRAKSRMLCKSTLQFLAWYQGNSYQSSSQSIHCGCDHVYE